MARERRQRGDPWRSEEEGKLAMRAILGLAGRLDVLLRVLGVRPREFRELLRVRILLALRPSVRTSGWGVAGIGLAVGVTFLTGFGTGFLGLGDDARTWIVVSQSVLVLLLVTLLLQFLASVLVDPTGVEALAPHPVDDRTLLAVRLAETFGYLLVFVASFTAGNVLVAVTGGRPAAALLAFPPLSLLCGITTLGIVALLFAVCLRVVGPAQFQRVTLWAQIVCGAVLFAGLQLFRLLELQPFLQRLHGWRWLWPPWQYAELFQLASGGDGAVGPSVAALTVPIVALALTFWLAGRSYVAGVQAPLAGRAGDVSWPGGIVTGIGRRLARGEERAGFDHAAALSRREPHFLRAILPQLVMFQAMALGMGLGLRGESRIYLPVSAGFLAMVMINVLTQAQSTAQPEARAVFEHAPVVDRPALVRGGVEAMLVQWFALPALALLGVHLAIGGLEVLPRSVLALELALVLALLVTRRFRLPILFTRRVRVGEAGAENIGIAMLGGLALILLTGAHWALSRHPVALFAGIGVAGWAALALWRRLEAREAQG